MGSEPENPGRVTALVVAGGLSSRWMDSVESEWINPLMDIDRNVVQSLRGLSKLVAPIHGVPLIVRKMESLASHGVNDFVVRLGHHSDQVRTCMQNATQNTSWNVVFEELDDQISLLSQIKLILGNRGGDCFVVYGDTLTSTDYSGMLRGHRDFEILISAGMIRGWDFVGDTLISAKLLAEDLRKFDRANAGWDYGYERVLEEFAQSFSVDASFNMNTLSVYVKMMRAIADGSAAWIVKRQQDLNPGDTLPERTVGRALPIGP